MRTFFIIWLGQFISANGSRMTNFAIKIWAWEQTGQVTTLTLMAFVSLLPGILIAPVAGLVVDRYSRKQLMMLGDTVAIGATLILLLLYLDNSLRIWHIYVVSLVEVTFYQFQHLAYSASISMLVPKQHYTRASSMEFLSFYGALVVAPALAGSLYYIIGFPGIVLIDIITFSLAILTVIWVHIPQPIMTQLPKLQKATIISELHFGFRYVKGHPSLFALLTAVALFNLPMDLSDALYSPLILARTDNDAVVLGTLASAAGIGGVIGASFMSIWGGHKRRINGVLSGMIGVGISKFIFGLSRTIFIWIPAQVCSSFNFPVIGGSDQAIWLSKVEPELQGRVFAANQMARKMTLAVAFLVAGPLADYVFEPAMMPSGSLAPIFGGLFGTGRGAGIALLYALCAICMLLVGFAGYAFPLLRNVECSMPDHDSSSV
ncbi:Macrolide efflux protein A [Halomicronema hongdechloris C2206]|uniref:Macrolide efflux protein A n=1 Tax=Halomicronema hongdechloris C2206 TaxID=1641165 RepID=A0A1Z3HL46_9CYAN|nr:MFS transporter [Halomicronema hongdechloris]ASC71020.1 Macrolide efflux protein A [Halomicronema hongdechloris C2206]